MSQNFYTIDWKDGKVLMIDQRLLPQSEIYNEYTSVQDLADAIRNMVIRGAPAIGCATAMGIALAAHNSVEKGLDAVLASIKDAEKIIAATRPTAVNLFWALDRMKTVVQENGDLSAQQLAERLRDEALKITNEDIKDNQSIGRFGAELIPQKATILTHCNAGALATGGYGTALGVIRGAVEAGKEIKVFADETRPWLQGARLTSWELARDGIDVTVITDSMAGALMKQGLIDVAVVGSDRIVANGDVANKIGTYTVAVLCRQHGVPFFVAAPTSTVDLDIRSGDDIPIEERPHEEVTTIGGTRFVPEGVPVRNIAFDVTPASFVSAIITEQGVARAPYEESLENLVKKARG